MVRQAKGDVNATEEAAINRYIGTGFLVQVFSQ